MDYLNAIKSADVVLIEFFASWCPHCQRMMSVVEQIRELLEGRVPVYQYDIDQHPTEASEADVNTIPTFIIFKNGEEQWRYSGKIDGNELLSRIEGYLR